MTLTSFDAVYMRTIRTRVQDQAPRIAKLGNWPGRLSPDSLVARVPEVDEQGNEVALDMGGFDAGVACALWMIPLQAQKLSATLHAAYTPEAVAQVRTESQNLSADDPTTWWLAACSICEEGRGNAERFLAQLDRFEVLVKDPEARLEAARAQLADMLSAFEVRDEIPVALRDGGMQGAYLAGHELAGMYAESYGVWFLGTYHRTLGLEDFNWKFPGNPSAEDLTERLGRSGPVYGSTQFVKCADEDEFTRAVVAANVAD